jgi:hypothetical protein
MRFDREHSGEQEIAVLDGVAAGKHLHLWLSSGTAKGLFDLGTASFDTDLSICHSARFAKWIMRVVAQTIGDYIGVGLLIVDSVSPTAARLGTLIRAAAPEKPTNDRRELRRSTDISTDPSPSHLASS